MSNAQGNHGEDVKDYWFYTDNLPTHAYASMVYKYPQAPFPYDDLRHTNQDRGQDVGEYELFDVLREQWLQQRYFDVGVEYAKATPEDVFCRITVTNRGPDAAPIHVLPQLWYRNTWSWEAGQSAPRITKSGDAVASTVHPVLGARWLSVTSSTGDTPQLIFCQNETNNELLFGSSNASPTSKDGINDYVIGGDPRCVSMTEGSKVAAHVTASPPPPQQRWGGRNSDWQHFALTEIVLMPDAWEYPWFAAWDLAFHCVTMALIDPEFAKEQVLVLLQSTTQHPHGQIPAYEWSFGDTNPPVHAWAAWQVYQLDRLQTGVGDRAFLAMAYRGVTLHVMWWLNQKDASDRGVFGGGFLGMDNIGVFNRDEPLPTGGSLAQVDGTAWIAALVFHMLEITIELATEEPDYLRMFGRWLWDAWLIANALEKGTGRVSFWNERTGFYHDVIELPDGTAQSLEVFSMQAIVPLFAGIAIPATATEAVRTLRRMLSELSCAYDHTDQDVELELPGGDGTHHMFAVVGQDRLAHILNRVLDHEQFLAPNGIRSLSKYHRQHPYVYHVDHQDYGVSYAPAESCDRMFGGNSNWRGPIWMPMNFLFVQALDSYGRFLGDTFTVADPADPGAQVSLDMLADAMSRRLTGLMVRDPSGRRAMFGDNDYFQSDPHWKDLIPFHEYFDGDSSRGLGASHQTGWTATIALLLQFRGRLRFDQRGHPATNTTR